MKIEDNKITEFASRYNWIRCAFLLLKQTFAQLGNGLAYKDKQKHSF